jgi:hypothetical protein
MIEVLIDGFAHNFRKSDGDSITDEPPDLFEVDVFLVLFEERIAFGKRLKHRSFT